MKRYTSFEKLKNSNSLNYNSENFKSEKNVLKFIDLLRISVDNSNNSQRIILKQLQKSNNGR